MMTMAMLLPNQQPNKNSLLQLFIPSRLPSAYFGQLPCLVMFSRLESGDLTIRMPADQSLARLAVMGPLRPNHSELITILLIFIGCVRNRTARGLMTVIGSTATTIVVLIRAGKTVMGTSRRRRNHDRPSHRGNRSRSPRD